MDGIAIVGTDVHPVDPEDRQELRQDKSILRTQLTPCIGNLTKAQDVTTLKATHMKTQCLSQNAFFSMKGTVTYLLA